MSANRYQDLIVAAIEAKQLKIELRAKLEEVAKNITAHELRHMEFEDSSAASALGIIETEIEGIYISDAPHVFSKIEHKDVSIGLGKISHQLDGNAIKEILKGFSTKELLGEYDERKL